MTLVGDGGDDAVHSLTSKRGKPDCREDASRPAKGAVPS